MFLICSMTQLSKDFFPFQPAFGPEAWLENFPKYFIKVLGLSNGNNFFHLLCCEMSIKKHVIEVDGITNFSHGSGYLVCCHHDDLQ